MVVPRIEYFPYADREGDGVFDDESALFVPESGEDGTSPLFEEGEDLAILINVPRVVKGVYVFWGGLDRALIPLFGEPAVDILYTEMFSPKKPELAPSGSLFGPLTKEGIPVLKWNGKHLARVRLKETGISSMLGRDFERSRAGPLGHPDLLTGKEYTSEAFRPVMTLPLEKTGAGSFQYRAVVLFGDTEIEAHPLERDGLLHFNPWNEAVAGLLFRESLIQLRSETGVGGRRVLDFDHLKCILFIEKIRGEKVEARTEHLLLNILF